MYPMVMCRVVSNHVMSFPRLDYGKNIVAHIVNYIRFSLNCHFASYVILNPDIRSVAVLIIHFLIKYMHELVN